MRCRPSDRERLDEVRTDLLDSVAESDDDLLERYLEGGEISRDEIVKAIHEGIDQALMFPVTIGAATKLIGVDRLMDVIVGGRPVPLDLPPPAGVDGATRPAQARRSDVRARVQDPHRPLRRPGQLLPGLLRHAEGRRQPPQLLTQKATSARGTSSRCAGRTKSPCLEVVAGDIGAIAKLSHTVTGDTLSDKGSPIVYPAIEPPEPLLPKAIEPKTKGDEDKLMIGLQKMIEEDPSLRLERNDETHQTILWGMGDAHLDVMLHRLKTKFSVEVEEVPFKVPYRSTLRGKAEASRAPRQAVGRARPVRDLQHPGRAARAR